MALARLIKRQALPPGKPSQQSRPAEQSVSATSCQNTVRTWIRERMDTTQEPARRAFAALFADGSKLQTES